MPCQRLWQLLSHTAVRSVLLLQEQTNTEAVGCLLQLLSSTVVALANIHADPLS
jgi:hypothetical protein